MPVIALNPATPQDFAIGSKILFRCDEYRNDRWDEFIGTIQTIRDNSVDVVFMSGYKSRNETVPYNHIWAKLDKRRKHITLANGWKGHFLPFATPPLAEAIKVNETLKLYA